MSLPSRFLLRSCRTQLSCHLRNIQEVHAALQKFGQLVREDSRWKNQLGACFTTRTKSSGVGANAGLGTETPCAFSRSSVKMQKDHNASFMVPFNLICNNKTLAKDTEVIILYLVGHGIAVSGKARLQLQNASGLRDGSEENSVEVDYLLNELLSLESRANSFVLMMNDFCRSEICQEAQQGSHVRQARWRAQIFCVFNGGFCVYMYIHTHLFGRVFKVTFQVLQMMFLSTGFL